MGSTRPFLLSDASKELGKFSTHRLNPILNKPRTIPNTGLPQYDLFFEKTNKAIVLFKMGETTIESALQKQSRGEGLQEEMESARLLQEELSRIIADIPSIESSGKEIQKNLERDFSGMKQAQLPVVSLQLTEIIAEIVDYSYKAPKILTDIQRLLTDSNNFSKVTTESMLSQEKSMSLSDLESSKDQDKNSMEDQNDTEIIEENKNQDPKPDRKINGHGLPEIRRVSGGYSPKSKKVHLQESGEERELTDQEKTEREYNRNAMAGLLDVFKSESRKDVRRLSNITLTHPIPRVRAAGALGLGRLKQGRLVLEKSIKTDGFVVRSASYQALAEIGHIGSLPIFIAGLKSDEESIQASSFLGLGKTRDPVGRELILSRGLSSDSIEILTHALKGLAYYKVPSDLELISKYLSSDSKELNIAAIEALIIHNTPESLIVLENSLVDQPRLAYPILDAIGKNQDLAATLFLVRVSQLYEDEEILKKIGSLLLKRKAYGTYGMVIVKEDRIRDEANERSSEKGIVRLSDVGTLISKGKRRFVVRIGNELLEDVYYNMKFENRIMGARNRYSQGWIFGKKIQLIQINKPFQREPGVLKNLETGKYQNLYDPVN